MIRPTAASPQPDRIAPPMPNSIRGEFSAIVGGERFTFDTTLGTIARIEDACGGRSIMEIVHGVVFGRKARDQIPLLAAALGTLGKSMPEAQAIAARATVPEAEAFILALMGALGFKLTPRTEEGGGSAQAPLDGSIAGAVGGNSPSVA